MLNIVPFYLFFPVMSLNNWKDNHCERGHYNKYMYSVAFLLLLLMKFIDKYNAMQGTLQTKNDITKLK